MKSFIVQSKFNQYKVSFLKKNTFHNHLIKTICKNDIIILDKNVYRIYKSKFHKFKNKKILLINSIEANKSFKNLNNIIRDLMSLKINRESRLIAIGGGIIQDITCFIASTIFRGINWIFYPTTLLAQADSCIGSKSSINFDQFKNLIGTFYPPKEINIDIHFLSSLNNDELHSGIGEIIKVYIIDNSKKLLNLSTLINKKNFSLDSLEIHIKESLKIKKKIIEIDELDTDFRKKLNYGHSFGHAIESATNYKIPHGIAVTIGMDIANFISNKIGNLDKKKYDAYKSILSINSNKYYYFEIELKKMISALSKDKKNIDTKNLNLILWSKKNNLELISLENNFKFKKNLESYFASKKL